MTGIKEIKTAEEIFNEYFGDNHVYSEVGRNQIIKAMEEYKSQGDESKGIKWVKASERLPDDWSDIICRDIETKEILNHPKTYFENFPHRDYKIEWLDESKGIKWVKVSKKPKEAGAYWCKLNDELGSKNGAYFNGTEWETYKNQFIIEWLDESKGGGEETEL